MSNRPKSLYVERADRLLSHTLVDLRPWRYLPLGVKSGLLLDVSLGGCKIELESQKPINPGTLFWVRIPLVPLGIYRPRQIQIRVECRWFDSSKNRVGVVFVDLDSEQKRLLEQIFDNLKVRGATVT